MDFQLFYFLAAIAEPVMKAVEGGANSVAGTGFWHTWGPGFLGPIVIAGISAFGLWWRNRSKNKVDQDKVRVEQFSIFMNESQEFREETRKERELLKIELLALQAERKILLEKLGACEQNYKEHQADIKKYTLQLEVANKEIETLTLKIQGLKERVVMESDATGNGKI